MVNPLRVRQLSKNTYSSGTVVYQMCRDVRAQDNDALLFAQELAQKRGAQLIVNYVIWNYVWEGATRRFYDWVLPSLQEVEEVLRVHNIPLVITFEHEKLFDTQRTFQTVSSHIGAVVIDQLPLRFMRKWKEVFLKHNTTPLYEVDTHNCVPVWETSPKQEFSARTIRSKIHKKLPQFLESHGKLCVHDANQGLLKTLAPIDWNEIKSNIRCNEEVMGVGMFTPGEKGAHEVLEQFLDEKLTRYDTDRNDFTKDGQSNLSPYITHGNVSRRTIIRTLLEKKHLRVEEAFDDVANGSNGQMGSVASFIEECVVRAELAENFCFYNEKYDSFAGFPSWAKVTLVKASSDVREYIYSQEQFEQAETHDDLWNSAQRQMVETGKMHGYMRMYWAKKILEWTKSPEEAMRIAVCLNDIYELDGRDPNGFVGCAWSIGGLHDRPWFGRLVFGTVRYMAESGVKKRGDMKEYMKRWGEKGDGLF
ncbi:MAG: Deoxyribodipyrimidine photolyase [Candidatus Parcubacteria bacterium]|jgi:deoxyribodipyrimidine photo-lyase